MLVINKVFLQAIGLLAMTALNLCAQVRQEYTTVRSCYMLTGPEQRGNDNDYDSTSYNGRNLEDCKAMCMSNDTCWSAEFRNNKCLFSGKIVRVVVSPFSNYTLSIKRCSDIIVTTASTTTTPIPTTGTSTTATTTTTMAPTTTTTVSGDYNSPCPTDMSYFGGSCYGVGHSKITWFDAQTVCEMIGASLAVMDSEVENAYLKVIAKDHNFERTRKNIGDNEQHNDGDITWIGALSPLSNPSEIQWDDRFVWIGTHGKILPLKGQPGFQDWGSYQPNMNGEGCVVLWSGDFFRWHDVYCDQKHNYICELQPTNDS